MSQTGTVNQLINIKRTSLAGPLFINKIISLVRAGKYSEAIKSINTNPDYLSGFHSYSWGVVISKLRKLEMVG